MSNVFADHANGSIYDSAIRLNYKCKSKDLRYDFSIDLNACNLRNLPLDRMAVFFDGSVQVKKDADSGVCCYHVCTCHC